MLHNQVRDEIVVVEVNEDELGLAVEIVWASRRVLTTPTIGTAKWSSCKTGMLRATKEMTLPRSTPREAMEGEF
ncbi:hypothetical protein U1Q18_035503 [Sarracenia purpurea var. burkii]